MSDSATPLTHPLVPRAPHGVRHPSRREMWLERPAREPLTDSHSEIDDDGRRVIPSTPISAPALSPARPAPRTRTSVLSQRDEDILLLVGRLHFLTTEQIAYSYYAPSSLSFVRKTLHRLTMLGMLARLRLPHSLPGNAPYVYTLGSKGRMSLRASDLSVSPRVRSPELQERSYLFLSHTLALNDVLLGLLALPRVVPGLLIADLRHERDLRQTPIRLPHVAPGELRTVIPDAWVDLRIAWERRVCLWLELDRGTAGKRAWKRKVRALLACAQGPYEATFGTRSLTFAVVTTTGAHRAEQLGRWCEQVLTESHQEALAPLFLLTSLPPGPLDPRQLAFSLWWAQPLSQEPTSLLPHDEEFA